MRAPGRKTPDFATLAAGVASALWLAAVGAYALGLFSGGAGAQPDAHPGAHPGALSVALVLLAGAVPVALFLAMGALARRAGALGDEVAALRAALGAREGTGVENGLTPAMARTATEAARAAAAETAKALSARLDRIEAALGETREGVAAICALAGREASGARAAKKTEPQRPEAAVGQPALPFSEPSERPSAQPIAWADIVRALDFPRSDQDAEGFAAMRAALRDPEMAKALQAAEDVLTILAADGLHMEDLRPDPASLPAWRAYAEGARGAAAAAIGGVRDPAAVEAAHARIRRDPIFRDAGLVFVRRWNGVVARVFRELGDDPVMLEIADTRSGRAFMLVARAMGAFD